MMHLTVVDRYRSVDLHAIESVRGTAHPGIEVAGLGIGLSFTTDSEDKGSLSSLRVIVADDICFARGGLYAGRHRKIFFGTDVLSGSDANKFSRGEFQGSRARCSG